MADTLSESLMGLNVPASENAWGIGASTLGAIAPKLINPYGNVGTNLGVGLGSVLLTALLGYQARQTAAEESLTTNKIANQLMSLRTPEERVAAIETAQTDLSPRLTSRLLNLNTALASQERANAIDIAKAKGLEEAKLQVAMSPLGEQLYQRQLEQMRQTQEAINQRQLGLEGFKQGNRIDITNLRANQNKELMMAREQLNQLQNAGKLSPAAKTALENTIDFGNNVQSVLSRLEDMSTVDYKWSLANPNANNNLGAAVQSLKNIYTNQITGKGITDKDREMINIATGSSPIAGIDAVKDAWSYIKSRAAEKGKSIIAVNTLDTPSILSGLDQMAMPGGSFSYGGVRQKVEQNQADLEAAFSDIQPTPVAPNTVAQPPASAGQLPTDPEFTAFLAKVRSSGASQEQQDTVIRKALARRGL